MPTPREMNKNIIRQAESSCDKTFSLVMELINRLNTTGKEVPALYEIVLSPDMPQDENALRETFGNYHKILVPLLTSIYLIESTNETLQLARRQI